MLSKYGSNCISVYSANTLGLDDVDYCSHVENNYRSRSSCWSSSRTGHPWKTTQDIRLGSWPKLSSIRQWWIIFVFEKKSSTSALGRACSNIDIFLWWGLCFAFEDANLSVPFFRSVGGLLVKVNSLDLWLCERKCPRHPLWYLASFSALWRRSPKARTII